MILHSEEHPERFTDLHGEEKREEGDRGDHEEKGGIKRGESNLASKQFPTHGPICSLYLFTDPVHPLTTAQIWPSCYSVTNNPLLISSDTTSFIFWISRVVISCKIHLAVNHVLHKASMSLFFQSFVKYRTNLCRGLARTGLCKFIQINNNTRLLLKPPLSGKINNMVNPLKC